MLKWAIVVVLLASAGGSVARADGGFVPLGYPHDQRGADTSPVVGFASSGGAWLVVTDGRGCWLTRDQGRSWARLDLTRDAAHSTTVQPQPVIVDGPVTAGPDGAFYVGAQVEGVPEVLRVTPGGAVTRLWLRLPPSDYGAQPLPFFDGSRRFWVELDRNTKKAILVAVVRFGADRETVADRTNSGIGAPPGIVYRVEAVGRDMYLDVGTSHGGAVFRLVGGRLEPISGALAPTIRGFGFEYGALWPVLADGSTIVASRGISLDGGRNWGGLWGPPLEPVRGSSTLLVRVLPDTPRPAKLARRHDGVVLTRWSRSVWRPSGLVTPSGTTEVVQTQDGLVAVGAFKAASLAFHRGQVPPAPTAAGTSSAISESLVERVNHFRKQASLPPVEADALIARAAENHAHYLHLNHVSSDLAGDYHAETPGKPGFTGATAADRCAALGVSCSEEVIESGAQIGHPVDDWIASFYHRLPLTSPVVAAAGAGRDGRYVVMDLDDADRRGFSSEPLGFPVGSYDGPLTAPKETPNPLDECRLHGQTVGRAGATVTFQPPTEEPPAKAFQAFIQEWPLPDVLRVTLERDGKPVPGCSAVSAVSSPLQNVAFIPSAPLAPHATYTATALWRIDALAPTQKFSWTFTTG